MKRRVCGLLLAISIICLPVQQVYAAPAGPAAHEHKHEHPKPHEHEHPVPPHEHKHMHPKPHEHEHPVPPHEHEHEHPVPPHEKEEFEKPSEPTVAPTSTPTAAPTATPKPTETPVPTAVPTVVPSEVPEEDVEEAPTTSTLGCAVVKYALQFVGNPYKYGGTSLTNGADCSGFVQSIYAHFDCELERTSRAQAKTAGYMEVALKESELQPGDLIFYANSNGVVYHVAIYIGDGKVVHAANSRKGITISEYTYMKPYKARRVF